MMSRRNEMHEMESNVSPREGFDECFVLWRIRSRLLSSIGGMSRFHSGVLSQVIFPLEAVEVPVCTAFEQFLNRVKKAVCYIGTL